MMFKINLLIAIFLLCLIAIGCLRKYCYEKKHWHNGICPNCDEPLIYKGNLYSEQQWKCPKCKYTTYIDWIKNNWL